MKETGIYYITWKVSYKLVMYCITLDVLYNLGCFVLPIIYGLFLKYGFSDLIKVIGIVSII